MLLNLKAPETEQVNRAKSGVKLRCLTNRIGGMVYAKQLISFTADRDDKKGIQYSTSAFIATIVYFFKL